MIRRPPRSTLSSSSAASDVYKRQGINAEYGGDSCFNMLRSVLLLLAGLALNAMARVPQECIDSCERLMNGMNKTCNALCDDTAGLMSQECVASLSAWSSNHSLDATAASASSANVAKWSEVLVVTLEQVEKDPSQAEKLIMEVILKGYLKDFGSYAKCKAVESAHYCYTCLLYTSPSPRDS
eukprot:TRINITY_DN4485_c0_g2_i4.p1 TRINITY_DN4485_c0_g2~~TRINITY_DN4485_c0_g2_i4.p1  ORF type:complete len:182 (-),score=47.06 TRINITY_DN4485_c0_g2_i4:73-618(-)